MSSSATCECGAEEQTVDHGLHGLRVWTMRQPNGCSTPAPKSSAAKQWIQLAQKKKKKKEMYYCSESCVPVVGE